MIGMDGRLNFHLRWLRKAIMRIIHFVQVTLKWLYLWFYPTNLTQISLGWRPFEVLCCLQNLWDGNAIDSHRCQNFKVRNFELFSNYVSSEGNPTNSHSSHTQKKTPYLINNNVKLSLSETWAARRESVLKRPSYNLAE